MTPEEIACVLTTPQRDALMGRHHYTAERLSVTMRPQGWTLFVTVPLIVDGQPTALALAVREAIKAMEEDTPDART